MNSKEDSNESGCQNMDSSAAEAKPDESLQSSNVGKDKSNLRKAKESKPKPKVFIALHSYEDDAQSFGAIPMHLRTPNWYWRGNPRKLEVKFEVDPKEKFKNTRRIKTKTLWRRKPFGEPDYMKPIGTMYICYPEVNDDYDILDTNTDEEEEAKLAVLADSD